MTTLTTEQLGMMSTLTERYMASTLPHPAKLFDQSVVDSLVALEFVAASPNEHYAGVALTPAGWDFIEYNTPSTCDVINPNEDWPGRFCVTLDEHNQVRVAAQHAQDALDIAIDYAERRGWEGMFLNQQEIDEAESDGTLGDHLCGGNHCRYLSSLYGRIEELR